MPLVNFAYFLLAMQFCSSTFLIEKLSGRVKMRSVAILDTNVTIFVVIHFKFCTTKVNFLKKCEGYNHRTSAVTTITSTFSKSESSLVKQNRLALVRVKERAFLTLSELQVFPGQRTQ